MHVANQKQIYADPFRSSRIRQRKRQQAMHDMRQTMWSGTTRPLRADDSKLKIIKRLQPNTQHCCHHIQ